MSSRRSTAAPPRCRAGSRPGRRRGAAAATARHEHRLLHLEEQVAALVRRRPVDAQATRIPASSMSRTGATPPRAGVRRGQWATPVPLDANWAMSASEVDAVGAPDVVGQPAEPVEVLDGLQP
jgi:hypothetical protein